MVIFCLLGVAKRYRRGALPREADPMFFSWLGLRAQIQGFRVLGLGLELVYCCLQRLRVLGLDGLFR